MPLEGTFPQYLSVEGRPVRIEAAGERPEFLRADGKWVSIDYGEDIAHGIILNSDQFGELITSWLERPAPASAR